MKAIFSYFKIARLDHWIKNILLFVPLVFSLELFNLDALALTAIAFISFCSASSAVYILNDVIDEKTDLIHPIKKNRPIASGAITKINAIIYAALLIIMGLLGSLHINALTCVFILIYLLLNILYSIFFKKQPIFDCFCIAAGFLLRVYAGGAASGSIVSDWLFLTIVSMSLFMAFGKRRGELINIGDTSTRTVLEHYNLGFLKGIVFICAGLTIVFYALWAMDRGFNMIYTVPLAIFIIMKYLLLIQKPESHGDPTTVIFTDKTLLGAVGVFCVITIALLYGGM